MNPLHTFMNVMFLIVGMFMEKYFPNRKKHGLELEEEPSYGGREYLEKQDYIWMKQKKDIASLEESIRSQIEVVNHKKYEIFEQEVQYKENLEF